jgi:hypothetical protein
MMDKNNEETTLTTVVYMIISFEMSFLSLLFEKYDMVEVVTSSIRQKMRSVMTIVIGNFRGKVRK